MDYHAPSATKSGKAWQGSAFGAGLAPTENGTAFLSAVDWGTLLSAASMPKANISQLARTWGVGRTTIIARLRTMDTHATLERVGAPRSFDDDMEAQLADHVLYMADCGYAYTKKRLRQFVTHIVAETGLKDLRAGGKKWLKGFLKRHPEISDVRPKGSNGARASKFNRVTVNSWFSVFEPVFAQYTPAQTYNADDKFFNLETILPRKVRQQLAPDPSRSPFVRFSHFNLLFAGTGSQGEANCGSAAQSAREPQRADCLRQRRRSHDASIFHLLGGQTGQATHSWNAKGWI